MKQSGALIFVVGIGLSASFSPSIYAQAELGDEVDLSDLDEISGDAEASPKDTVENKADEFDLESPSSSKVQDAAPLEDMSLDEELKAVEPPADDIQDPAPVEDSAPTEEAPMEASPAAPPVEEPVPTPEETPAEQPPSEQPVAETVSPPAPEPVAPVSNEPNAALEARLDRIFQKFMSSPTTDEEWLQIAGEKSAETYSVQAGDTLWDISVTFFGNGNFWPKIWQLNDDITNPHMIQPGRVIKFSPGTLSQSPSMQVTDAETPEGEAPTDPAAAPEPPNPQIAAAPEPQPELEEPPLPPAPPRPAVVRPVPDSLPMIITTKDDNYDKDGFAFEKQALQNENPPVLIQTVLKEAPIELGKVVGVELDRADSAALYQYVFVQGAGLNVGDVVTTYEVGPEIVFESEKYGRSMKYTGNVKIVEKVESDEENVFKALVVKSFDHVRVGASLARESAPLLMARGGGTVKAATGQVIGGPGDLERKMYGEKGVAFLNAGSEQGLKPGDIVNIVRNELRRNPKSIVRKSTAVIGQIKLGQVSDRTSTGIVLSSKEAIHLGDLIATGPAGVSQSPGAQATPDDLETLDKSIEPDSAVPDSTEPEATDLDME